MRYVVTHASDYFFVMALQYEDRAIVKETEAAIAFARGDVSAKDTLSRIGSILRQSASECLDAAVDFEPKRFPPKGIAHT